MWIIGFTIGIVMHSNWAGKLVLEYPNIEITLTGIHKINW